MKIGMTFHHFRTLRDSLSNVSKAILQASGKDSFESYLRDLHDSQTFTPLRTQHFSKKLLFKKFIFLQKIPKILQIFVKF